MSSFLGGPGFHGAAAPQQVSDLPFAVDHWDECSFVLLELLA
jgi:hypothetical protein